MTFPVQILFGFLFVVLKTYGELQNAPSGSRILNLTSSVVEENHVGNRTLGSQISSIINNLSTLRTYVIFICIFAVFLITCLVVRLYRSGKKKRKPRKYDIITTPAERIEMAPLNEENEDEEDSTLFDIKYR